MKKLAQGLWRVMEPDSEPGKDLQGHALWCPSKLPATLVPRVGSNWPCDWLFACLSPSLQGAAGFLQTKPEVYSFYDPFLGPAYSFPEKQLRKCLWRERADPTWTQWTLLVLRQFRGLWGESLSQDTGSQFTLSISMYKLFPFGGPCR